MIAWTSILYWMHPKRLRDSWPLLAVTSFGIVTAVTLMAVGAGYSNALAEGGLRHTLASTSQRVLNVQVITQNRPIGPSDYRGLRSVVTEVANSRLGNMLRGTERYGIIQGDISITREPLAASPKLDGILSRPFFLTGFQDHSNIVEGRWPQGTPTLGEKRVEVEAVLGKETASQMSLTVGARVDLIPFIGDKSERISVHVVGVAEPIDSSEEFWMNPPSSYYTLQDRGDRLLAPFFITEESFFDGIATKYPLLVGDFTWFLFLNTDVLTASQVKPTKDALNGLETDINQRYPRSLVFSGLNIAIREYERELLLARVPIFLFISLLVLVVLYFLVLVVGLLARSRTDEASLLRSRGASLFQVSGLLVISEGVVAVVAMIAGPFLALAIVRYFLLSTINPVGGTTNPLPVGLSPEMFLMGVVGGLLSLAVLVFSSVNRARMGISESLSQRARPPTLPFLQRYYVDLLVLAAVAFLMWQINGREGFLVRELSSQALKLDLVSLFGPVLVLVGVAVVVLRLLPLLARLMAWSAERMAPAWIAFPLVRLARDPLPQGSLVVIIILASALGIFGATFQSTLSLSQTERTLYAAGGDIAVSGPSISASAAEKLAEEPAIQSFSPVVRVSATMLDVFPSVSTTVLAIDPGAVPDMVWFRDDFADKSLFELLQPLRSSSLSAAGLGAGSLPGVAIPSDTRSIGIWVEKSGLKTATLVSTFNLWARVYNSQGRFSNLFLGELSPIMSLPQGSGAVTKPADSPPDWVYLEAEVPEGFSPVGEHFWLVSIHLSRKSFTPVLPGSISFDDITLKGPSSPSGGLVVEGFEEPGGWVPFVNQGQIADVVERTSKGARSGESGLTFTWEETFQDAPRGVVIPTDPYPLPVIGGPNFQTGEVIRLKAGKHLFPVVVQDTTKYFPTLDPASSPFLILPLDSYRQYVRRTSLETVEPPKEIWVSLDAGADRGQVAKSLKERLGTFVRLRDRDLLVETATRNPLAGGGWNGLTILGMSAIIVAVLLTLVIHALVAVHSGRVDLTVARTLGFSRLQLFLSLALERLLLAVVGLAIGSVVGVWLARWVLSFLDITARGKPSIPPMVIAAQEWLIVVVLGGLMVALLLGLIVAAVFARRLKVADILRVGN